MGRLAGAGKRVGAGVRDGEAERGEAEARWARKEARLTRSQIPTLTRPLHPGAPAAQMRALTAIQREGGVRS